MPSGYGAHDVHWARENWRSDAIDYHRSRVLRARRPFEKIAPALPDWFFLEDGEPEKQRANKVALIYDEAADFKAHYSDQLAAKVKDSYPELFGYVMQGQKEGASFLMTWVSDINKRRLLLA